MNALVPGGAAPAAVLPLRNRPANPAGTIIAAARLLLPRLERGERIDAEGLRASMEAAFGASDAAGRLQKPRGLRGFVV